MTPQHLAPQRQGKRGARRGGAAIELALTAPILLSMATGVVEWGWFMNQQVSVVQAARDAARAGALSADADEAASVAVERFNDRLAEIGADPTQSTVAAAVGDSASGIVVTVTVDVPYPPLLGLLPTPERLRASTTMRLEGQ
jgi:Flp pilus assembly protein TadG